MGIEETPQQPSDPQSPPAPAVPADSPGEAVNTGSLPDDLAPDADDPGDDLPAELADQVHEGDVQPDAVDRKDVEE